VQFSARQYCGSRGASPEAEILPHWRSDYRPGSAIKRSLGGGSLCMPEPDPFVCQVSVRSNSFAPGQDRVAELHGL